MSEQAPPNVEQFVAAPVTGVSCCTQMHPGTDVVVSLLLSDGIGAQHYTPREYFAVECGVEAVITDNGCAHCDDAKAVPWPGIQRFRQF